MKTVCIYTDGRGDLSAHDDVHALHLSLVHAWPDRIELCHGIRTGVVNILLEPNAPRNRQGYSTSPKVCIGHWRVVEL